MARTTQDIIDFMRRPNGWPARPFLPVVKEDGGETMFGVLIEGRGSIIFRTDLISAIQAKMEHGNGDHTTPAFKRWAARLTQHRFASMREALDDGWIVD